LRNPSLPGIVQWFKTMTSNALLRGINSGLWSSEPGRLWQRNYHEHVIRDERDLTAIRDYIATNPARWDADEYR